jgi:uncharacterized protein YndB with AHSA1/START domain
MQIDISARIGAVVRQVRADETYEGRRVHVVASSRAYPTDAADLWDALTNPERIPRWFLPVSGDLRLGGRYQLEGNAGGEITACDPPTRLAVTWEFGGGVSWLTVRLTAEGAGSTRLDLEHVVPDDDHWRTYGPGATGVGWDLGLLGLALHVESGKPVDPSAFMAWMGSATGREYMTRSSEEWGQVGVGAGIPDAEESAARTTAFYTGG